MYLYVKITYTHSHALLGSWYLSHNIWDAKSRNIFFTNNDIARIKMYQNLNLPHISSIGGPFQNLVGKPCILDPAGLVSPKKSCMNKLNKWSKQLWIDSNWRTTWVGMCFLGFYKMLWDRTSNVTVTTIMDPGNFNVYNPEFFSDRYQKMGHNFKPEPPFPSGPSFFGVSRSMLVFRGVTTQRKANSFRSSDTWRVYGFFWQRTFAPWVHGPTQVVSKQGIWWLRLVTTVLCFFYVIIFDFICVLFVYLYIHMFEFAVIKLLSAPGGTNQILYNIPLRVVCT